MAASGFPAAPAPLFRSASSVTTWECAARWRICRSKRSRRTCRPSKFITGCSVPASTTWYRSTSAFRRLSRAATHARPESMRTQYAISFSIRFAAAPTCLTLPAPLRASGRLPGPSQEEPDTRRRGLHRFGDEQPPYRQDPEVHCHIRGRIHHHERQRRSDEVGVDLERHKGGHGGGAQHLCQAPPRQDFCECRPHETLGAEEHKALPETHRQPGRHHGSDETERPNERSDQSR